MRHAGSDPQAERGRGEVNLSPIQGLTLRPRVGGFLYIIIIYYHIIIFLRRLLLLLPLLLLLIIIIIRIIIIIIIIINYHKLSLLLLNGYASAAGPSFQPSTRMSWWHGRLDARMLRGLATGRLNVS